MTHYLRMVEGNESDVEFFDSIEDIDKVAGLLSSLCSDCSTIYYGADIVGHITENDGHIYVLYIIDKYRNMGFGKQILDMLKSSNQMLSCSPFTTKSQVFFSRNGFVVDTDINPDDENTMVWRSSTATQL